MLREAIFSEPLNVGRVGIRSVERSEAEHAVGVIMLAFSTDPAARWLYPNPADYLIHFPYFIRAFAGEAFKCGTAYVTPEFEGAALWLPPGVESDERRLVELFEATTDQRIRNDLFSVFEQMDAAHPKEPHWYLPMIGVDTSRQGNGIGSELMRYALERCDEDRLPAYLESSNPRNVPLYERFGFEVQGTIQAGSSPPLYPMLRKAR